MKKSHFFYITVVLLIAVSPVLAQNKLAITDKAQVLTQGTETALTSRLKADSIELTSMIDTRRRCDYWFAELSLKGDELLLSVVDCNDKTSGTKNLGSKITSASDSEKALLLYYAISEILGEPFKDKTEVSETEAQKPSEETSENSVTDSGSHKTRYFFSPSAYNLEKGELYYNSLYFFVHDVQYGITSRFSLGMGTTIIGIPFYFTPKITIPINEKSAVAIGDMLMIGTWGTNFSGNLLYATYTRGDYKNNASLGGGYLHTGNSDITGTTNTAIFNFSALLQLSGHIYFITENYSSQVKTKQSAYYYTYDPVTYESTYNNGEFKQNMFFIYGMTGFRFINKNKDVRSWQVGLTYIFRNYGEIPYNYKAAIWNTSASEGGKFFAFPVIGYARKFSTKF